MKQTQRLERDFEGNTKVLSNTKEVDRSMIFRALNGFEAYPSKDIECLAAAKHTWAMISCGMCAKAKRRLCLRALSNTKQLGRAAISNAKWLPRKLEQWFRTTSSYRAQPSKGFERKARLLLCFRMLPSSFPMIQSPIWTEREMSNAVCIENIM